MTAQYWFKPKQYGYGAVPVTWEGWALTLLVAILIAAASAYLFAGGAPSLTLHRRSPGSAGVAVAV